MRGMIIPLWREGIVILLFAEWWKGRNKTQSPDSTVEKLFLSLFFPCMYIFLLLFPLSLSLSLFAFIVFTRISFRDNVAQQRCVFANAVRFRVVFFSQEYRISLLSALSHLEIESPPPSPPMVISFGAIYIGFARVETPLSVAQLLPRPPPRRLRGNFIMRFRE